MDYVEKIVKKTKLNASEMVKMIGIHRSRYYEWKRRKNMPNQHNHTIPKSHWILDEEKEGIIHFCKERIKEEGYKRLTYQMIDSNIAFVSESTTYRILKQAECVEKKSDRTSSKGKGFKQPLRVHEHWHMDISYINILGTMFFLICVLDGASRYIVHHELRKNMTEFDVELTLAKALEKYPEARPRLITDNGSQFISKEFKSFIRFIHFTHVRTSVNYPQSNGKIERFHKTIKKEHVRKKSFLSLHDARGQMDKYIEFYNKKRLHSAIGYVTPEDVLKDRKHQIIELRMKKIQEAKKLRREFYKKNA